MRFVAAPRWLLPLCTLPHPVLYCSWVLHRNPAPPALRPLPLDRSYHGEPLEEPMAQLAVNALQYYLSQGEVEKEWSESY